MTKLYYPPTGEPYLDFLIAIYRQALIDASSNNPDVCNDAREWLNFEFPEQYNSLVNSL